MLAHIKKNGVYIFDHYDSACMNVATRMASFLRSVISHNIRGIYSPIYRSSMSVPPRGWKRGKRHIFDDGYKFSRQILSNLIRLDIVGLIKGIGRFFANWQLGNSLAEFMASSVYELPSTSLNWFYQPPPSAFQHLLCVCDKMVLCSLRIFLQCTLERKNNSMVKSILQLPVNTHELLSLVVKIRCNISIGCIIHCWI